MSDQSQSSPVKNRSEILFLYDGKWMNPNGDPVDENKPRIDEETGINYVTDVRLKRTVRDYLNDIKKKPIFVKGVKNDKGDLKTKEDLLTEYKIEKKEDLFKYIDIRLFGSTTAIKGKSIVYTGPVQFNYGRSLHRVVLNFVKGTTVMPSKEAKGQGTFTENYVLPYSLVAFHGIINEHAGTLVNLTNEDVDLLLEAIWYGTQNLITRSKFGQMPRLLIQIKYKESANGFYIGDLLSKIKIVNKGGKIDEALRDVSDYKFNMDGLKEALLENKTAIQSINYKTDNNFYDITNSLTGFSVEKLSF